LTTIFDTGRRLGVVRPGDDRAASTVTGVILAGERAWRHDSLESLGPRALLPVGDRPLIAYASEWLTGASVSVSVCTNVAANRVWQALTTRHTSGRIRFFKDDSLRGPSGCVADVIAGNTADAVIVIEGSVIPTLDLRRLLRAHAGSHAIATIVTQPRTTDTPEDRHADVPAGVYVFNRAAFEFVPSIGYQDIKEGLLRRLYEAGAAVRVYEADDWCPRVIDTRSYLAASQWAIRRVARQHSSAVVADSTSQIADGAMLIGPVLIGPNAVIMDGASVIGPAAIGRGSTVQPNAVVSRAMVWDQCSIGSGAFVDQTVLANGAVVDSGATLFHTVRVPAASVAKPPSRRLPWSPRIAPDVVTVATTD
jgi:NDP-sugar pyrophosphorylase family protein